MGHRAGNGSSLVLQLPFLIMKQLVVEVRTWSSCRNGISVHKAFEMFVIGGLNLKVQILCHLGKYVCIPVMESAPGSLGSKYLYMYICICKLLFAVSAK